MRAVADTLPPVQPADVAEDASGCAGLCQMLESVAQEPILAEAQRRWAARPIAQRLKVVRGARHRMAAQAQVFAEAISPALQRSKADTLLAELLPTLDAMRFLERSGRRVLAVRRLGRSGRPMWLGGLQAEVHREPLGHVLVIGPSNFPLFLTGVQIAQALVAGNAVTWKPGVGGRGVALLMAHALRESGLPRGVLRVTEESVEAAAEALAGRPNKVVFTGSFETGQRILRALAETTTPAVMELSGADAVVVLPSAEMSLAAKAIAFGLRLNGAEVCMSPRRLVADATTMRVLRPLLEAELATVPPVRVGARTAAALGELVKKAIEQGARVAGEFDPEAQRPMLVENARAEMEITKADVFAPVLSLMEVPSVMHIAEVVNACPYALTAAIFGAEREARALGGQLQVGAVLINDLIASTVDPRVPFGGRGRSGFGSTRGAEGLLEMTAAKTVLVRRKGMARFYQGIGERELPRFAGLIGILHGGSMRVRWSAMKTLMSAGRGR